MNQNDNINPSRVNISLKDEFHKRMKEYSQKEDIAFSALIREALRLYTNDSDDCFIVLAQQHAGSEAADLSAIALKKHKITQSHFLGHIMREAAEALQQLKEGGPPDQWKGIKCALEINEGSQTPPDDEILKAKAEIESQMKREIQKGKKTG